MTDSIHRKGGAVDMNDKMTPYGYELRMLSGLIELIDRARKEGLTPGEEATLLNLREAFSRMKEAADG